MGLVRLSVAYLEVFPNPTRLFGPLSLKLIFDSNDRLKYGMTFDFRYALGDRKGSQKMHNLGDVRTCVRSVGRYTVGFQGRVSPYYVKDISLHHKLVITARYLERVVFTASYPISLSYNDLSVYKQDPKDIDMTDVRRFIEIERGSFTHHRVNFKALDQKEADERRALEAKRRETSRDRAAALAAMMAAQAAKTKK